jgi:hypothetical protein
MENTPTYITKSIDLNSSFLYDRREIVTAPLWSTNSSSLESIYTSSNQHHHQKIYYLDVYSNENRTSSLDVDFSIAYGHILASGSSTASYGFIITDDPNTKNDVSESKAIYSQYRNSLLDGDKLKYVQDGKFRFFGYANATLGSYYWGKEYWFPFISPWQRPYRIDVLGNPSNISSTAKSISVGRSGKRAPNSGIICFVSNNNKLYVSYPIFNNNVQIGNDSDWSSVSVGHGHVLALKQDGTLWVGGDNEYGQLGLGFVGNEPDGFVKLSNDTWKFVCAGAAFSFGIKTDGTLWSWGYNNQGQLGLSDYNNRDEPTEVTSYGTDDWTMIATSNAENFDEFQTVMGIQSDGTLWAWGDGNSGVTNFNPSPESPYQLGTDTDWETVSVGKAFAVAIKGGALKSWGSNDENGTLGINSSTPSSFPFGCCIQTPSADTNWSDVSCGPDFVLAINNSKMYGWGSNKLYQLGYPNSTTLSPTQINTKIGWSKVETAPYMSVAVITNSTQNPITSMVSEDLYAISVSRQNFRDRIEAGNWELSLSAVSFNDITGKPEADTNNIITLVDESIDFVGTPYSNPSYKLHSLGGEVYGVYSGSLTDGLHINADREPYGLFFPDNGKIILNGELLMLSASIETRRTEATSSGGISFSSNAEFLFTSISASMTVNKPFKGTTVEIKMPTYCFIRINNNEFNVSNNPSYYTTNGGILDQKVVKDNLRMSKVPFVYITTIGLYNDNGDLLAVAKLSKPLKKTYNDEFVIKIKLDI